MFRTYLKAIALLTLVLGFQACNKESNNNPPISPTAYRVFVVCEGSLGNGNGQLWLYDPHSDKVYADAFKTVNNQSLGDVFQSMQLSGDRFLLCINNSDKIISIGATDLAMKGICTVPKPRYVLNIDSNKSYVSSLFGNKLFVIDPHGPSVSGSITLAARNPEGMLLHNGKVYVCPWDTASRQLYVLDPVTDQVSDSILLPGYAPQEVLADKDGKLWILSGNVSKGKIAFLTKLDPQTRQILEYFPFPSSADPIHPVMNSAKDSLYFIEVNYAGGTNDNGVYRMSVNDHALPAQPFVQAQSFQYFWGLGIDPLTGEIYIGDPKGFTQQGTVFVYRQDGTLRTQFNTGVGPGHFYFSGQ